MEDDENLFVLTEASTICISAPENPKIGDIWYDISTMNANIYTLEDTWITVDSDSIDLSRITFDRVMFEDDMPDPQELKRMCEEYPGLEKAYENFKTIYKMVEQDWRGKQDEEPPF